MIFSQLCLGQTPLKSSADSSTRVFVFSLHPSLHSVNTGPLLRSIRNRQGCILRSGKHWESSVAMEWELKRLLKCGSLGQALLSLQPCFQTVCTSSNLPGSSEVFDIHMNFFYQFSPSMYTAKFDRIICCPLSVYLDDCMKVTLKYIIVVIPGSLAYLGGGEGSKCLRWNIGGATKSLPSTWLCSPVLHYSGPALLLCLF